MIVCSCNVLSDRDVRTVLGSAASVRTVASIYGGLDCAPECGRCAGSIRDIIDQARRPERAANG